MKSIIWSILLLSFSTLSIQPCCHCQQSQGFDGNGASYAVFSVGKNKQVRFSRGNLQYHIGSATWRFSEHQYDYLGKDNETANETKGYMDLFCWGTSGWNSGAVIYQPNALPVMDGEKYFLPGDSKKNNLTNDYAHADWGVHNAIKNGGNRPQMWRTPTKEEMEYLFCKRPNAKNKYGAAMIGNICGTVVLPDNWTAPSQVVFIPGTVYDNNNNVQFNNRYSLEQWAQMENAGAIFFPWAGEFAAYSSGPKVWNPGKFGYYWTSTAESSDFARAFWVAESKPSHIIMRRSRNSGLSVRLVMDVPSIE